MTFGGGWLPSLAPVHTSLDLSKKREPASVQLYGTSVELRAAEVTLCGDQSKVRVDVVARGQVSGYSLQVMAAGEGWVPVTGTIGGRDGQVELSLAFQRPGPTPERIELEVWNDRFLPTAEHARPRLELSLEPKLVRELSITVPPP